LNPKFIILDEIDSWLDITSFKNIANILKDIDNEDNSIIIITHRFELLEYITPDEVIILKEWKILKKWDNELVQIIKNIGFDEID
jgi:Fe-S cluster assembly ATPase SufC